MASDQSVAIIVPFYQGEVFLDRLHESLKSQGAAEVIVVVDDGTSAGLVTDRLGDLPGLKVLETAGSTGTAAARNTGVAASTADWIACLDQDDWWPADFLRDLRLTDADQVVAYDCDLYADPANAPIALGVTVNERAGWTAPVVTAATREVPHGLPMLKILVRRELFEQVGGYRTWAYAVEDFDFITRLLAAGATIALRESPRGAYLDHADSTTNRIAAGDFARIKRAQRTMARIWVRIAATSAFPIRTRAKAVVNLGRAGRFYASASIRQRRDGRPGAGVPSTLEGMPTDLAMSHVLIGDDHGRQKVFGPFPSAEDAREFCNMLGMPQHTWTIVPVAATESEPG